MSISQKYAKELARQVDELEKENARLRQSITALIEVYAPAQRKSVLRKEHLEF